MIQEKINAAAPGSKVEIPAGTYAEAVNVNKAITLCGVGGEVVLDKKQLTVTAAGAVVADFAVDGYQPPEAVLPNSGGQAFTAGVLVTANNVVLQRVRAARCGGTGIGVVGVLASGNQSAGAVTTWRTGVRLNYCVGEYNGRNGICASFCEDLVLADCVSRFNNTKNCNTWWEAGAGKFYICRNVLVLRGKCHDNTGNGWWADWDCDGIVFDSVESFNNHARPGQPAYEAYGLVQECTKNGAIRNCYSHGNGGNNVQIALWNAHECMVEANYVDAKIELRKEGSRAGHILQNIQLKANVFVGSSVAANYWIADNTANQNRLLVVSPPDGAVPGLSVTLPLIRVSDASGWSSGTPTTPPAQAPRLVKSVEEIITKKYKVTFDDGATQLL